MRRIIFSSIAAFAIAGTVSPLAAQDLPSEKVAYGDLTLSDSGDMDTLKQRLRDAAKSVCRDTGIAERQCVDSTYRAALYELKSRTRVEVARAD